MTELWNLLPSTVPSVLALLIIILAMMVLAYITKEMLTQTQLMKARVMAALPPQAQGSSGPFAQMWAVAESYLAGPFHYLRKGIYAFILLFGGMIWAKSSGSTQIAFSLAGLEFIILIALFVRWQWLGLSALLGGVTAVLKQTATNDPDISEAILEGVKVFGKIIGWTLFVLAVVTFGILMVPWESSTELTYAFFSFLAVVTGVVLYAWLAGFKTARWRNVFVFWPMVIAAFAFATWGLFLMAQHFGVADAIWKALVATVGAVWVLMSWNMLWVLIGLALIGSAVALLIQRKTWVARRGLARRNPTMRRYGIGLLLLGLAIVTIPLWSTLLTSTWNTKTETADKAPTTKVQPAEKLVAEKLKKHKKKVSKVVEKSATAELPKNYRNAVEGEVTLTDNEWLVMQIPSREECISYHPNVGTEDKRVGNHYMIRSLEGPLETYVHILELGESLEDYTCTN